MYFVYNPRNSIEKCKLIESEERGLYIKGSEKTIRQLYGDEDTGSHDQSFASLKIAGQQGFLMNIYLVYQKYLLKINKLSH